MKQLPWLSELLTSTTARTGMVATVLAFSGPFLSASGESHDGPGVAFSGEAAPAAGIGSLEEMIVAAEQAVVRGGLAGLDALAVSIAEAAKGGVLGAGDRSLVERFLRLVLIDQPSQLPVEIAALREGPHGVARDVALEAQDALKLSASLLEARIEAPRMRAEDMAKLRGEVVLWLERHPLSFCGRRLVETYMSVFGIWQRQQEKEEWKQFVDSPNATATALAARQVWRGISLGIDVLDEELDERMARVAEEVRQRRASRREMMGSQPPAPAVVAPIEDKGGSSDDASPPKAAERQGVVLERSSSSPSRISSDSAPGRAIRTDRRTLSDEARARLNQSVVARLGIDKADAAGVVLALLEWSRKELAWLRAPMDKPEGVSALRSRTGLEAEEEAKRMVLTLLEISARERARSKADRDAKRASEVPSASEATDSSGDP